MKMMPLIIETVFSLFSNTLLNQNLINIPTFYAPSISLELLLENADIFDVEVTNIIKKEVDASLASEAYSFVLDGNLYEVYYLTKELVAKEHQLYCIDGKNYLGIMKFPYLVIIKEVYDFEALLNNVDLMNMYLELAGLKKIRLIVE